MLLAVSVAVALNLMIINRGVLYVSTVGHASYQFDLSELLKLVIIIFKTMCLCESYLHLSIQLYNRIITYSTLCYYR